MDTFYTCNNSVLCYVGTAHTNGQHLSVTETFPGIQDPHTISTAYITSSFSGSLDFEHSLPSLLTGGSSRGNGVDLNAVIFLENVARMRDGGSKEYAQELENMLWWSSVNLGLGYAKRSPARMTAKKARWKQMSYLLSSDPRAFQNTPLPFATKYPAVAWFSSQCNEAFAKQRIHRVDAFIAAVNALNERKGASAT